jgi:hypothetical protein
MLLIRLRVTADDCLTHAITFQRGGSGSERQQMDCPFFDAAVLVLVIAHHDVVGTNHLLGVLAIIPTLLCTSCCEHPTSVSNNALLLVTGFAAI